MGVRFYQDEDVDIALAAALRQRGIGVLITLAAAISQQTDDGHLAFAARTGRALVTHNRRDFARLHTAMMEN